MSRKLFLPVDDESSNVIKRYEQFLSGKAAGYFDVEELEDIIEFYLRRGRTKDCTKALELGQKLHPNSVELQTKRAKIYLVTGDDQKAYRILETLSESTDYEVLLLKIEVMLKLGLPKEASALSKKIIADEADDLDNVCLDLAFVYLSQGEYETALELLIKGDGFNARNKDLLHELAFCYEQTENYVKAIETYNRIIDVDSYSGEAWFNMGQLYFALQEFPKALNAYEFALAIDDKDSLTCLQKAHVHFQLDQFDEAIETYLEYGQMTENKWETDIFVAECYEKLERYDDAIAYYKKSLENNPHNYDALTGIGICLLDQEKYAESMPFIQQALTINAEAPDAWVYLAEAYIGIEDINNAMLAYLKSITLDPEQPDTLMAIANICLENGEFETAIEYYLNAQAQDDTLEFVNLFLAVAEFQLGNIAESAVFLQKAIADNESAMELFFELCPGAASFGLPTN